MSSMRRKLVPLIAIAFVVAIVSTGVFYSLFAGRLNGAEGRSESDGAIVVAAKELKAGSVVGEDDVDTIPWKGPARPAGTYGSAAEVAGKTVFDSIPKGEPVLASRLVSKDGAGVGIPEGMRAVSVHVSDSSGVVGILKPGHKVDIQVFGVKAGNAARSEMRTLLRGVTVLSVNSQPEPSSQGYFAAPVITLLAPVHEAEELARADSFGRLRITLRNPLEAVGPGEAKPTGVAAPHGKRSSADSAARLQVSTIALTDEGFAELAKLVDAGARGDAVRVYRRDAAPVESLVAKPWAKVQSASTVPAGGARLAYYRLPQRGGGCARIGLLALDTPGRFRIRPEVCATADGRAETHSVETEIGLASGALVVVTGLVEPSNDSHRHWVVLISRRSGHRTAS